MWGGREKYLWFPMCKNHFRKSVQPCWHWHWHHLSSTRWRKGISKCQQRHKESAETEGPLLDSCIFHDHITVSSASVSKRTTLILLHCKCFWCSSLFPQIYPLNVKCQLSFTDLKRGWEKKQHLFTKADVGFSLKSKDILSVSRQVISLWIHVVKCFSLSLFTGIFFQPFPFCHRKSFKMVTLLPGASLTLFEVYFLNLN